MILMVDIVLLIGTTVLNGMLGGLYLAFACAVLPGTRGMGDRAFVQMFRAINRAILHPVFLAVFALAPVMSVVAAALRPWAAAPVLAALLALTAPEITMAVSVPLNGRLERGGRTLDAWDSAEGASGWDELRAGVMRPWARWNVVRALASAGASVLGTVALL